MYDSCGQQIATGRMGRGSNTCIAILERSEFKIWCAIKKPSFGGSGLVYWGLTPQQQPGSYQGGQTMTMKSVFWWRKPEYLEETTDLRQGTDETFHTYGLCLGGSVRQFSMVAL